MSALHVCAWPCVCGKDSAGLLVSAEKDLRTTQLTQLAMSYFECTFRRPPMHCIYWFPPVGVPRTMHCFRGTTYVMRLS